MREFVEAMMKLDVAAEGFMASKQSFLPEVP